MKGKRDLLAGGGLIGAFVLWTVMIQYIDVQAVGQNGTRIGFAAFNEWFHQLTGVHLSFYAITDWLGLIKRRSLLRVDPDILLLGVYYVVVIFCYLVFEMFPINYRPVLIEGRLEASYPSSTTLLVLSVMPTLMFQADRRARDPRIRRTAAVFVIVFSVFMVIGRLLSGVHWATDIVGSILLSAGLFLLYRSAVLFADGKKAKQHLEEY